MDEASIPGQTPHTTVDSFKPQLLDVGKHTQLSESEDYEGEYDYEKAELHYHSLFGEEDEREKLRDKVTSSAMRSRALEEVAKRNGH